MSKINSLFNQVFRPLATQAKALEDGVVGTKDFDKGSMRKQFIHNVMNHETLSMTKAGAASYYQMCKNRAAGTDMYASHKTYNKSQQKKTTPVEAVEVIAEIKVDISNRWWVGSKENKSVFASFTSRKKAQDHNGELKSQGITADWIDSTKINTDEFKPAVAA